MPQPHIPVRLFESYRLGSLSLKNRIVHPPVLRDIATKEGFVTEQVLAAFEAVAKGGTGLIVTGATMVDPRGRLATRQLAIYEDSFVPGLKELAAIIHKQGAKAAVQLHHGGVKAKGDLSKLEVIGACAPTPIYVYQNLQLPPGQTRPRQMEASDIKQMIHLYAKAAQRAKDAGFDAVEIQAGGPGFLISQFLTAALNTRKDEYGGDMRNRSRFLLEVITAVRESVGENFSVWCRMNAEWAMDVSKTVQEGIELGQILRHSGLNAVHVSGQPAVRPFYSAPGYFLPAAEMIRRTTGLPVIAGGGVDYELGEKVLAEGRADLIAMARPLIADPELPNKLASGRYEDIRPCLGCSTCFDSTYYRYREARVQCLVNPAFGADKEFTILPAPRRKKVMVIGGGAAGMEAARVAAERGHEVILMERASHLGGQLVLASCPPNKHRVEKFRAYLERQLLKNDVQVLKGQEANLASVADRHPDVVILATGSRPMIPAIPGKNSEKVIPYENLLTGKAKAGDRVVIVGGGMIGCELADYLARQGKRVTIVEMLDAIMPDINPSTLRLALLEILRLEGVTFLVNATAEEITPNGLGVSSKGGKKEIPCDSILFATGARSNRGIEGLEEKIPEVYMIGDALEPRRILQAVAEGFRIALRL